MTNIFVEPYDPTVETPWQVPAPIGSFNGLPGYSNRYAKEDHTHGLDSIVTGITINAANFSGGSIDIGGFDATSFHVDTSGNMWVGNAAFGSAPFRVASTGSVTILGTGGGQVVFSNAGGTSTSINATGYFQINGTSTVDIECANFVMAADTTCSYRARAGGSSGNHDFVVGVTSRFTVDNGGVAVTGTATISSTLGVTGRLTASEWIVVTSGIAINSGGATSGTFAVFCNGPASCTYYAAGGNGASGPTGGQGFVGLTDNGSNRIHFDWSPGGDNRLHLYIDNTNVATFNNSGAAKTFVIDHPVEKNKFLVHACAEGPTADVFYRGVGELVEEYCEITLPGYFESLVEDEGRTIQITPFESPIENLHCSAVKDGKFTVHGKGRQFCWRVDGIRKDVKFNPEPRKDTVRVEGFGPYQYIR